MNKTPRESATPLAWLALAGELEDALADIRIGFRMLRGPSSEPLGGGVRQQHDWELQSKQVEMNCLDQFLVLPNQVIHECIKERTFHCSPLLLLCRKRKQ